jgi:hypothetical protein
VDSEIADVEEFHLVRDRATGRVRLEVVYVQGDRRFRAAASGFPEHTLTPRDLAVEVKAREPMPGLTLTESGVHVSPDYLWRARVDMTYRQDGAMRVEWNEIGQEETS